MGDDEKWVSCVIHHGGISRCWTPDLDCQACDKMRPIMLDAMFERSLNSHEETLAEFSRSVAGERKNLPKLMAGEKALMVKQRHAESIEEYRMEKFGDQRSRNQAMRREFGRLMEQRPNSTKESLYDKLAKSSGLSSSRVKKIILLGK